mmetsp:Transcript_23154/g.72877  ORF Transcript_23154/g.72877 Transcript_23154/m.72877 type:complete len:267 (+) Transcript_23154:231-1031(+)
MHPAVGVAEDHVLVSGEEHLGRAPLEALAHLRDAAHHVPCDAPPIPHLLEGEPMDDVIVGVHAQEPVAEFLRLPPRAKVAVSDTWSTPGYGHVWLPVPVLGLCYRGGKDRQGTPQAVAREDHLPVTWHRAVVEHVASDPPLDERQHPLQRGEEALVHQGPGRALTGSEWEPLPLDIRVHLPVLHRCSLGPPEGDNRELRAARLEDAGVDVVVLLIEHVDLPIPDLGAEVNLGVVETVAQGRAHALAVDELGPRGVREEASDLAVQL